MSLNSEVTLFNGLQQLNKVKQMQFDYLAKKYDSDKIRNDMSLNIAASYLSILFNLELVNNANRQVEITKEKSKWKPVRWQKATFMIFRHRRRVKRQP